MLRATASEKQTAKYKRLGRVSCLKEIFENSITMGFVINSDFISVSAYI